MAAYYVFAYAQFEVYVRSFVEDSFDALNALPPAFDRWPDLMLGYVLHRSENLASDYRRFGSDEDEGAILKRVAQIARKVAAWSINGSGQITMNPSDFLEKKKYPSPKNLPQLFRRLGIEQIWAVIGRAGRMNGKLLLTSLNDLRTEIAHEGKVPPGFSLRDCKSRVEQMKRLVAALDRGILDHFCSCVMSRAAWNRAMV